MLSGDGLVHLPNRTYWMNEYLHVGHFHYEIVLLQLLSSAKVNRVVMQRAACAKNLCQGIGSMESYYKGLFAIMFEAFGQPDVPVYMRYSWKQREVTPVFFSVHSKDFYANNSEVVLHTSGHTQFPKIQLNQHTCFDELFRRAPVDYGATPLLSAEAVIRFKATAFQVMNAHVARFGKPDIKSGQVDPDPTFTYFNNRDMLQHTSHSVAPLRYRPLPGVLEDRSPYRLLLAYRGKEATRYISNLQEFVHHLAIHYPSPVYEIALLDTSNVKLTFEEQLHAVASSHVVICNHGAFEGNMMYMHNAALLVELFGNYGNNEVNTFHRLAMVLGLFYARLNPANMTDHKQQSFVMLTSDMKDVDMVIDDYFQRRAYLNDFLSS